MKARTNCNVCRDHIRKEVETEFLKQQYSIFNDMSNSFATFAVTAALMTMVRRGRSKAYIRKLYDDMCFIFSTPAVMGKEIKMHDCMKLLEDEYGIDWDRINVSIETEKEFIRAVQKR